MTEKQAVDYLTGFIIMSKALNEIEREKLEEVIGEGEEEDEFVITGERGDHVMIEALEILLGKMKSQELLINSLFVKKEEE